MSPGFTVLSCVEEFVDYTGAKKKILLEYYFNGRIVNVVKTYRMYKICFIA